MSRQNLFNGTLLVAGTSIGGGMLALPVLTSQAGFLPSIVVYFLCWLFMAATGLLLLEVCLWMGPKANMISMSEQTLGRPGKWAAWVLYLFLFYCLTLAYIVGCGDLLTKALPFSVPSWLGAILFVALFFPIILMGSKRVGHLNAYLMGGLALSYVAFVFLGYKNINPQLLVESNWAFAPMALPIAFTAFSYQGIIPTLVNYLDRNPKQIRSAIIFGSFIPFIVYAIWQGFILGIIPSEGPGGLIATLKEGGNAVQPLHLFINNTNVIMVGQFFAFFALVTSFLGVVLGLIDFLADGLKVEQTTKGRAFLSLLVFIPPLLLAMTHPGLFLTALDYAGGYGCALLLGLLPILMVWSGRYHLKMESEYKLAGGKIVLGCLLLFVIVELIFQLTL